jgi:type VI secretion system Hcp family effector
MKETVMPTATHAYVRITGKHQGVFKSGVSRTNRGDNWMELLAYEPQNPPPRDPSHGSQTGRRIHGTLTIIRACGPDGQLFFKAHATRELLPQVEIEFANQHANGAAFVQGSVTIKNATITNISKKPPVASTHEIIRVCFAYQHITSTYSNGGKSCQDDWKS